MQVAAPQARRAREQAAAGPPRAHAAAGGLRAAAAVFAGALAVRALYLASVRGAPFFTNLVTEPLRYHRWAGAILDGLAPARPPFDEAPGYVYLLAALYGALGRSVLVAACAQAVLDAASCAAIALLARRAAGPRAGRLAGLLAALYGPLIYFTGELVPASLLVFAVSMALLATPQEADAPPRSWTLSGAAWAAALLARSEILAALPFALWHALRTGGRKAALRAAAVPAALLLVSLGVNRASSGHWVLLTSGAGVNLWLGNNPAADGVNPFVHGALQPVAREVAASARDSVEADEAFLRRALAFVRAEPGRAAALLARKLAWTFADRELPNTGDIEWQTAQSWLFQPPWFPLRLGLVLPLALAGAALLPDKRKLLLLCAPAAIALATCGFFFTNARFRLSLVVTLLPLAGIGAEALLRLLPQARAHGRALTFAALVAVAGALVAFANFDNVRAYRIPQIDANTGALERAAGNLPSAIAHLQLAVRGDPRDRAAWVQLAESLEESGQLAEARAAWAAASAQLPSDPLIRAQAARFERRTRGAR